MGEEVMRCKCGHKFVVASVLFKTDGKCPKCNVDLIAQRKTMGMA